MKASLFNKYKKSSVSELKRDQTVVYKLDGLNMDEYGMPLIPASKNVPPTDEVYIDGEWCPIAYITRVDASGEAVLGDIEFTKREAGILRLSGNNPEHRKLYEYLELCNFNASREDRSDSVAPIFKRVDTEKDAQDERAERLFIRNAINKAVELSSEDVKFAAGSLGMNINVSETTLRNHLERYAEDYPDKFMSLVEQKSNRIVATIKEAVSMKLIQNSTKFKKFIWVETKQPAYDYKHLKSSAGAYDAFATHIQNEEPEMLEQIQLAIDTQKENSKK